MPSVAILALSAPRGGLRSLSIARAKGGSRSTAAPPSICCICMQVLGADFVVDASSAPFLLEINASPQFGDPLSMPSLRAAIGLPMLAHLPEVLARSQSWSGDAEEATWPRGECTDIGESDGCGGWAEVLI